MSPSNQGATAMTRYLTLIAVVLTAAVLTVQWTSKAGAQAINTYVSASGSDANNCDTPAAACRSFFGALSKTADGGTVQCLDAGFFQSVTITISVTIDCFAGGASNTQRVVINAPGKTVILRNIGINALNNTFSPIAIQAAANVYIENALVGGSAGPAIRDQRAGPGKLVISNSSIVSNPGVGILVAPSSGIIGVELDNVHSNYNLYGLYVATGGRVMIKNSVFTGNSTAGIQADAGAVVTVNSTQLSFNSIGVSAAASATVTLNSSSIDSNSTAISNSKSPGSNTAQRLCLAMY